MPRRTARATPDSTPSPLTNPTGAAVVAQAEPGQSGEGFYQRYVGRKTGRLSPRPMGHGRGGPRHETILAAHGLMDQGAADPRQGQLFAPHELPSVESAASLAAKHGVAPPLTGSRPGFMPELYEKEGGGTVSTKQAHKRMIGGINRLSSYALEPDPDHPLTIARAMENRAATAALHEGDAPWYATRRERSPGEVLSSNPNQGRFALEAGSATEMITQASRKHGINYETMSRATALTSPRTAWTHGTPGTGDFVAPNIESASNVIGEVIGSAEADRPFDVTRVKGSAQRSAMAKAAEDIVGRPTSHPIPIAELQSQKVPNFNQSLLLAHPAQSVRKQAAMSYTVDTHDVRSMGAHEDLLKTAGGMAVARMTGRRDALRARELPPMRQSKTWTGQKSKTSEPMGKHSLFRTLRSGKVVERESSNPNLSVQLPDEDEVF